MADIFYDNSMGKAIVKAKKAAKKLAEDSGETHYVTISGDYYWVMSSWAFDQGENAYGGGSNKYGKVIHEYNPSLINVSLTPEEAKIVKDSLADEELETDGFHGGMFKTPAEKSLLKKLAKALEKVIS